MCHVRASFCFALLWTVRSVVSLELNADCKTPKGESGKCILFRECKPLGKLFTKNTPTYEDTLFLTESRCGVLETKTLMCCPVSSFLPKLPICGQQLTDRLMLVQQTNIIEYPWMALIQYKKPHGQYGFHCGGVLINERYIVTAAHCINSGKLAMHDWKVHRVRLGEWDLASAQDCEEGHCSATPIDLDIEEILVHSQYDLQDRSHANDIALVRFTRNVNFSETVRPICLPLSSSLRERNHDGISCFAAGWGITETGFPSNKKMKVELAVQNFNKCAKLYKGKGISLKPTQMCAVGVNGKDTCSGDSGGPLMRQMAGAWHMIGMVSYGPMNCGTKDFPAVYTNMAYYVDWIQDKIY